MKGLKKKMLSGLLCLMLVFLSACGNGSNSTSSGGDDNGGASQGGTENTSASSGGDAKGNSQGMGRYLETDVTLPEEVEQVLCSRRLADDTIRIATNIGIFDSKDDGKTFESSSFSYQLPEVNPDEEYLAQAQFDSQGRLLLSYSSRGMIRVETDGTEQELPIVLPERDLSADTNEDIENFLMVFQVTWDDMILGNDLEGNMLLIDPNSGDIRNEWKIPVTDFGTGAGTVVGKRLVVPTESGMEVYDTESGELKEPEAAFSEYFSSANQSTRSYSQIVGDGEDSLYYADRSGVYRFTFGAGKLEQVINGELCSLINPRFTLKNLIPKKDGGFLAFYSDEQKDVCKDYTYSKEAPAVPEHELKVYALKESQAVRQAMASFQAENLDYYISLELGLSGDDSITAEDAIKKLNTDLLAGKGPDILVTEGLPLDSYMEKGVLADLSEPLEKMSKEASFFENVLFSHQTEDGVYAVPTRFALPILAGASNEIEGIDDLDALTEVTEKLRTENPDLKTIIGNYSPEILAELLLQLSSGDIWESSGQINEDVLTKYIDAAKEIYQQNGYEEHEKVSMQMEYYSKDPNPILPASDVGNGAVVILMKEQELTFGTLRNMYGASMLIGASTQYDGSYQPIKGVNKEIFIPVDTLAVNAKSGDLDGAKKFVTEMMGTDAQTSAYLSGLPVNQDAFKQSYEVMKETDSIIGSSTEDGTMVTITQSMGDQEDYDQLLACAQNVVPANTGGTVITQEIVKIVSACMKEQTDTDQAVEDVKQAVDLYLAE